MKEWRAFLPFRVFGSADCLPDLGDPASILSWN
jgi:hypothetical protein